MKKNNTGTVASTQCTHYTSKVEVETLISSQARAEIQILC